MPLTISDTRDYLDWIENHPDAILHCRDQHTGFSVNLCRHCVKAWHYVLGRVVPAYDGEMVVCDNELRGCCERAKVTE